jgi:hypothetical protein
MTSSTGGQPHRSRSSHWRAGYPETGPSGSEGGRAEKDQPRLAPRRAADPSAWISKYRRTTRDYEHLTASHEATILWAMIAVDCTILWRSVPELVMFGGCLKRVFKKVFAAS